MIARLTGELIFKQPPFLMIDVNNVSYEMQAPMCTFYALPEVGSQVTVLTHLLVREDAHTLYAFMNICDRALFKELLKVSGIGAKIGLAILSGMDVATFRECIGARDAQALTHVPGIGQKTAERLIVEMRSRLDSGFWSDVRGGDGKTAATTEDVRSQAQEALVALGYKSGDAKRMLKPLDIADKNIEQVIREALKGGA